jgi:hypothetical protein
MSAVQICIDRVCTTIGVHALARLKLDDHISMNDNEIIIGHEQTIIRSAYKCCNGAVDLIGIAYPQLRLV